MMFHRKKNILDNRPQSVCLIPTDPHMFHKEISIWSWWDFKTSHQRKFENQVGANFHIGAKYLYHSNKMICMPGFISSY